MSTDYFHCRKNFEALPGVRTVRSGPYRFALPPSPVRDYLAEHITGVDDMIRDGACMKTSVESSAAVCTLPGGEKVFVKRNGNRGLVFSFRYFFVPARVFRAALAAERVREVGVATPRVFAAGENRRANVLLGGYLITEAVTDACDLMAYVEKRPDAPAGIPALIGEAARIAATLHDHGVYHGDLKLVNLYRTADDAPCGVWDLDSAQLFPGEVPHDLIVRELGRIVSSILIFAENNPAFPDDFFNLKRITYSLLDAYLAEAKTARPTPFEIMDAARTRWLSRRRLRFDYGEKSA